MKQRQLRRGWMACLLLGWVLVVPAAELPAAPAALLPALENPEGARLVYLDFWASWCVPCRKSFPWLNEMQARYGDKGLRVIGVNEDKDQRNAALFLSHYPADFQVVYDPDGTLASAWHLAGMPMSILVDRDGRELARHIGFIESKKAHYEQTVIRLLEETQ